MFNSDHAHTNAANLFRLIGNTAARVGGFFRQLRTIIRASEYNEDQQVSFQILILFFE